MSGAGLLERLRLIGETKMVRFVVLDVEDVRETVRRLEMSLSEAELKRIAQAVAEHENFNRESAGLGSGLFSMLIAVAAVPAHAFVLLKYWGWFGEPLFHVQLSLVGAIGLRFLMGVLVPPSIRRQLTNGTFSPQIPEWQLQILEVVVGIPIALLTGWIFHLLIS